MSKQTLIGYPWKPLYAPGGAPPGAGVVVRGLWLGAELSLGCISHTRHM